MLLPGLLRRARSVFSYIPQDHHPRDGPAHSGLNLFTLITNQETSHRLAYAPIGWVLFLNGGSLLDDASLCCVGKNQHTHPVYVKS